MGGEALQETCARAPYRSLQSPQGCLWITLGSPGLLGSWRAWPLTSELQKGCFDIMTSAARTGWLTRGLLLGSQRWPVWKVGFSPHLCPRRPGDPPLCNLEFLPNSYDLLPHWVICLYIMFTFYGVPVLLRSTKKGLCGWGFSKVSRVPEAVPGLGLSKYFLFLIFSF